MNGESKKKILYIITKSVWAGAGKYTHDLAVSLPRAEFAPMAAAGGKGAMAEKMISAGVPYFEIKGFRRDVSFFKDIRAFFEILSLLLKTKPDIIHVSSTKAGGVAGAAIFAYKIARKSAKPFLKNGRNGKFSETALPIFGIKTVFTAHGWAFGEERPKWQIALIKFFSKITCLFYDKIICVSEYDRETALKNKIAPAKKLTVIHNGVKPKEYDFLPREEAREAVSRQPSAFSHLDTGRPSDVWIGTIGEFTGNKGQKFLIEAIKKLSIVNCQLSIVIFGFDGGEKENLEKRIKKYGLENKIFLIDDMKNPAHYLKAFDIFILPSLKEGLPYTLLEAGLAELPIVATNVGGVPEITENGRTGILARPANADELADAVKKLIENLDLRRELGAAAREKILREFSFEKMLAETVKLYE